jgi:molybdopterin synthase sulfur carrier subunit
MVTIKLFADLREIATGVVKVEAGKTVGEALKKLLQKYPGLERKIFNENGEINEYISVFVNGHNVKLKGLDMPLKEDDEIALFPPVAGG